MSQVATDTEAVKMQRVWPVTRRISQPYFMFQLSPLNLIMEILNYTESDMQC